VTFSSCVGASTGIGRHAAEYLAQHGFTVLAGVRKTADADNLTSLALPNLLPVMLDVNDSQSIRGVSIGIIGSSSSSSSSNCCCSCSNSSSSSDSSSSSSSTSSKGGGEVAVGGGVWRKSLYTRVRATISMTLFPKKIDIPPFIVIVIVIVIIIGCTAGDRDWATHLGHCE